MKFRSDSQRRAVFANMFSRSNGFSLDGDPDIVQATMGDSDKTMTDEEFEDRDYWRLKEKRLAGGNRSIQSAKLREFDDIEFTGDRDINSLYRDLELHATSKEKDEMLSLMEKWKKKYIDSRPSEHQYNLDDVDWTRVYGMLVDEGFDRALDMIISSGSNQQVRYKIPYTTYMTGEGRRKAEERERKQMRIPNEEKEDLTETNRLITSYKMGKPKKWTGKGEKLVVVDDEYYRPLTMFSYGGEL